MQTVTFPKGRILWHARIQSSGNNRKNVMNSPDYLFTTPQIQQALYHGLEIFRRRRTPGTYIELTKLRVKEPLILANMESVNTQATIAEFFKIKNYRPFTGDDKKILEKMCKVFGSRLDGYRAIWDQDQIALCARVIRTKLERVATYTFDQNVAATTNVHFTERGRSAYYKSYTKPAKNLVKSILRRRRE